MHRSSFRILKSSVVVILTLLAAGGVCGAEEGGGTSPLRDEGRPSVSPEESRTTDAAVRRLVSRYGERLKRSRYLERGEGEDVSWPGWEGFPTRLYRYKVVDRATSESKQASVVLLDASPEQIARWVVTACAEARGGQIRDKDADLLFERIISQSGGQFPVAGVVYEDILPADGVHEIFCFRDGVTVAVEGVPHRGTAPLDEAQTSASLTGRVTKVYRYARIQSTSPSEYRAGGGTVDVGTNDDRKPAWLEVVRRSYQEAWGSDRYGLMSDWAKANLGKGAP